MSKFKQLAGSARAPAEMQSQAFSGFAQGLNTSVPATMIDEKELAECVNFQINRGGQLQSRPGMRKLNNISLGKIVSLASCSIGKVKVKLAQTADFNIHQVNDDGSSVTLGQVEGLAEIINYGGCVVIADGSYLKYIDESMTIKMVRDDEAPLVTNDWDYDYEYPLSTAAAFESTRLQLNTPSWSCSAGLEITKVQLKLKKVGTLSSSHVVTVYLEIENGAGWDSVGSGVLPGAGAAVEVVAGWYDINISGIGMVFYEPSKTYRIRVHMASGFDVSNHLIWMGENMGVSGNYNLGGRLNPNLPPKAGSVASHDHRLWAYHDPDNPGYIHFNNYALHDWSTIGQAGYITAMDSDKDTFEPGALASYYGSLFVYGTEETPYLLRLTGSNGNDFILSDLSQPIWSKPRMVVDILNDLWSLSSSGIASMTGVNMYGDVRTYSESFAIDNQVRGLWSTDAFTGYFNERGQVWVSLGSKVFVAHTKAPTQGTNRVRYPWSEFIFNFTPTCFGSWDDIVVGTEEGFIYTPDSTLVLDDSSEFPITCRTKYTEVPFQLIDILEAGLLTGSTYGCKLDFKLFKNGSTVDPVHTWPVSIALKDHITINDLSGVQIFNLDFAIVDEDSSKVLRTYTTVSSFQMAVEVTAIAKTPVFLDGLFYKYRAMED